MLVQPRPEPSSGSTSTTPVSESVNRSFRILRTRRGGSHRRDSHRQAAFARELQYRPDPLGFPQSNRLLTRSPWRMWATFSQLREEPTVS